MAKTLLICLSILIFSSCVNQNAKKESSTSETMTTYYLIRHAEKDRSDSTNADPVLTERGLERAALWAQYFDTIALNKIYATHYKRTEQTAKFISEHKKLPIESYNPSTLVSEDFIKQTEGKKVLIVGHSNTTPILANKLYGDGNFEEIPDNENSRLYIIELTPGKKNAYFTEVELK